MHDLNTIRFINAYAAEAERSKARGDRWADITWPSDAPAIYRSCRLSELFASKKAVARRKALAASAIKRLTWSLSEWA